MADAYAAALAKYEQLVAAFPEHRIKGAANKYTSLNGHMHSFLTREGMLAIRLAPDDVEAFRKKYKTGPVIQYNSTMRGYVEVPAALLARPANLRKWFAASLEYIGALPPKPTTKKAAKKKTVKKKAVKKKAAKKAAKKTTKKKVAKRKTTQRKTTRKRG